MTGWLFLGAKKQPSTAEFSFPTQSLELPSATAQPHFPFGPEGGIPFPWAGPPLARLPLGLKMGDWTDKSNVRQRDFPEGREGMWAGTSLQCDSKGKKAEE